MNIEIWEWDAEKFDELVAHATVIEMPYEQMDYLRCVGNAKRLVIMNAVADPARLEISGVPINVTTTKRGVKWPIVFVMPPDYTETK